MAAAIFASTYFGIKYLPVEVIVARLVGKLNEAISPEVPVKY